MYLTRLLSFISLLLFSTLLFAQKSTFLECKTSLSLMENSVPKEGKLNINNNREFFKNQPTIGYLASIGLRHENIDKSRLTISYGLQYWRIKFIIDYKAYYDLIDTSALYETYTITPNSIDPINETSIMVNENLTINFLGVYLRPNYNIKMFSIGFGIEISLINIYKGNYYYLMVNNNTNNNYSESFDYQKGSIYDLNGIVSNVGNQINFTPSLSYNISIKDKIGFKPFVEFLFPVKPFLKENSNLRFLSFNNHVGNFFFSFRAGFITEFCLKNRQKNKN